MANWQTGDIIVHFEDTHWTTHTHTHADVLYIYIRRMQRNIRPHTNTPQSLSLCSLPQPNCAEDTSYLTSLPSPDISPHKCAHRAANENTHTHTFTFSSSFSVTLSGHILCPVRVERATAWCVPCSTALYPPNSPTANQLPCRAETDHTFRDTWTFPPRVKETGILGNGLSIQLLFYMGNIAFIKMPPHWPPPPPRFPLNAFRESQLPTRLQNVVFRL